MGRSAREKLKYIASAVERRIFGQIERFWWEPMAGGMGGFFGHFSERFNRFGPFHTNGPCGCHPDSLKRAFRTYREFWRDGRLKLSMLPDNGCVRGATGYCLVAADKKHFVFFVEDADSVTIDLNGMPGRPLKPFLIHQYSYRPVMRKSWAFRSAFTFP